MTSDNETFEAWLRAAKEKSGFALGDLKEGDDEYAHVLGMDIGFNEGAIASRSYHLDLIKELVEALEAIADRDAHGVMVTIAREALSTYEAFLKEQDET